MVWVWGWFYLAFGAQGLFDGTGGWWMIMTGVNGTTLLWALDEEHLHGMVGLDGTRGAWRPPDWGRGGSLAGIKMEVTCASTVRGWLRIDGQDRIMDNNPLFYALE
jgi:hypothetical protein